MRVVHINEPFWGAGSMYGWGRIPGIGLSKEVVFEAIAEHEDIKITIGNDPTVYQISAEKVVKLAKKYGSVKEVRRGVNVAVIPQNELRKADDKE